jgi:two-component system, chemotaxis family, protein-glutamate methylesterase/glutaminase
MRGAPRFEMVVIGTSSGGMEAIKTLLQGLPRDFPLPVGIVQHIAPHSNGAYAALLDRLCAIDVKEAEEKEPIRPGTAYLAPANYHLLVEPDRTFSLTVDEPENCARPSIDVLFETAAEAYASRLIGIVMTGANADGARGLQAIKAKGGLTIVQDPDTAQARAMPEAAIRLAEPHYVLAIEAMRELLLTSDNQRHNGISK